MGQPVLAHSAAIEAALYELYRDFFDLAERKRRWSLRDDIPWAKVGPCSDPAIADVVESFCAVELYLPDYVANAMALFRSSRAAAWFYCNWGYEESKHSLALGDWLLKSRSRTEEQLTDLEAQTMKRQWDVPHDHPVAMLCYAMVQELATGLNYRNLRKHADKRADPALSKLLVFLSVDEQTHHSFFTRAVKVFLQHDRQATLAQVYRVLHNFAMPVIYELIDGPRRVEAIKALEIFDDRLYYRDVYMPVVNALGATAKELRQAAKAANLLKPGDEKRAAAEIRRDVA